MARDAAALLEDMIAEVRYLRDVTTRWDQEDLLQDETLRRAVERSLEILGEAAKAVPREVQERHPSLPWSDMARLRDFLVHAYHRVEPGIVWKTAVEDAAPLLATLEDALEDELSREPKD